MGGLLYRRGIASRVGLRFIAVVLLVAATGCSTTPEKDEKSPEESRILELEERAAAHPENARIHYELGNAYFDAQRYPEALESYETSVNLDGNAADALTNLGLTQRVLGDLGAAINSYERALAIEPDDVVTLQNLVVALQAEGRVAEAVGPLARLIMLDPSDVGMMADYAATLEALDRFEDASRVYTEVIKKRPDDMNMHYALGRCYFELERWADAIGAWRTVVAFDRDFGQAYSGLAAAYFETGDYDRAWLAVRDCQRLGAYTDPALISKLQEASGKLGPE